MRRALFAILLLGWGAGAVWSQTSPPAFTPRDESPEEFAAGAGRDETFYACTACHNFKLVAEQGMSRERWDETLTFMTAGHNMPLLEGAERKLVLDYLEKNYPPRVPSRQGGWQNPFARP
jgi:mono/diheme cytochrome c family protein